MTNQINIKEFNFEISWDSTSEQDDLVDILINPSLLDNTNNLVGGLGAQFFVIKKKMTCREVSERLSVLGGLCGFSNLEFLKNLLNNGAFTAFFGCLVIYIFSPVSIKKVPKEIEVVMNIFERQKLMHKVSKEQFINLMRINGISDEEIEFGLHFLVENKLLEKQENGDLLVTRRLLKNVEVNFHE